MTAAVSAARDQLVARGFTETEALVLLLPVLAETYREVADDADDGAHIGNVWGDTPTEVLRNFAAAYRKVAAGCDLPGATVPPETGARRRVRALHRQLVAARAEAEGLAEAMANAGRLYDQRLTEERGKLREAAAWIIRTGYPHDWTGDEHPPPAVWNALVDAVHDDPTGKLHGGELTRQEVEAWMRVETGRPAVEVTS